MAAMLGDLLAAARRSSGGFPALVEGTELAGRIDAAAAAAGTDPAAWLRGAVAEFERRASEEDWATLLSGLRGSADDPGATCLRTMVNWRLGQDSPAAAEETAR